MPLKLSVGLSRKQGLPNFGSAGATCLVEVELSSDALKESASFFEQAEKALEACRTVVEGELARQAQPASRTIMVASQPPSPFPPNQESQDRSTTQETVSDAPIYRDRPGNQLSNQPSNQLSNRPSDRPSDRPATQRQLQAIERLILRLGANPSEWLYQRIGETPPHCLSLAEASALIDELQQELPPSSRLAG